MEITEVTRRNIIDEIRASQLAWHGRLTEIDFLKRIFPLQEMPSYDSRFENMAEDICQHRINNLDWGDDWVYEDPRINLLKCDDKIFLGFLCEIIHPVVRFNSLETEVLLQIFNTYLDNDGYELCEIRKISGQPVFSARIITIPVVFENTSRVDSSFVKSQIQKCNSKLKENDYDGAISSARSLVEGILGEIFEKCTGKKLEDSGDLLKDYKRIKSLLFFSEEKYVQDSIKSITRSFNGIIQSIDTLSNKMGDRHRPLIAPLRHHAKLVVDSSITVADFLLSALEYQNSKKNSFLNRLLEILDSEKRNYTREQLFKDSEIAELLASSDIYLRQIVKQEFFKTFKVSSYRQSDIFFAVMRIFFEELNASDVASIYIEDKTNSQIVGWKRFERELSAEKPDLLDSAYKELYEHQEGRSIV